MAVQAPTPEQLDEIAQAIGLSLTDADLASFHGLVKGNIALYNIVDAMPDQLPPVKYPRTPGQRPAPEDNRHNAWYVKTSIEGAARGKLKGKKVAVKDLSLIHI
jgi:amidase